MSLHWISPPIADFSGPNASALDSSTLSRVLRPPQAVVFAPCRRDPGPLGTSILWVDDGDAADTGSCTATKFGAEGGEVAVGLAGTVAAEEWVPVTEPVYTGAETLV